MPRQNSAIISFNRGIISPLAAARADIKRLAMSAKQQENWTPRALGSMSVRVGTEHLGNSKSDAQARHLPFVFSIDDTALIEFTNGVMRLWVDDDLISRVSVSTAVTNGSFDTDVSSWADNDEAGGISVWVTGGYMGLTGNGSAAAKRRQQVNVAVPDRNKEHALRIVIQRGPVTLRVGSSAGDDDYVSEATLLTGYHSIAFTPTANFHIEFSSRLKRQVLVDSCTVEASGTMELTAPYATADLGKIRAHWETTQSGDVLFVACAGYQQRRIERRSTRSWSITRYQFDKGPMRLTNGGPITITPSALSGNITLTASAPLFRSTQAPSTNNDGALFRVTSNGQQVSASITAQNQFTNAINVTGVDAQRVFSVTVDEDAAGAATFTLQRSLESDSGPWTDVQQWTADVTTTFDDALDNQIAWYRLGVKTGDYVNGTHAVSLAYTVGSIDGVVRITDFTSSIQVSAEVLTDLGGTAATDDWAEGEWSDYRGWPTSGGFYEGRLFWAGQNGIWGSESDGFDSFNELTEGDSGPISRTVGSGPVDTINWLLPLQRLLLGAEGSEYSARASSLDEILTPTTFNLKPASSQGSAAVQAVKVDSRGIYVQRGGTRVFELDFDSSAYAVDYASTDLTLLCPQIGKPSITRMAVQRQPDTRVHCVRSDGTVAILVYDKAENLVCWIEYSTDGEVEDVVTLPGENGDDEDRIFYSVKRTINGSTKRYLEKWAKESECIGGTVNKMADCFVLYQGVAATNITAGSAAHLEGEAVVVWADGTDVGTVDHQDGSVTLTHTIVGGILSPALSAAAANIVVGLPYTADFESGKLLALYAALGTPLTQQTNIQGLGLILANAHRRGLTFGPDFDHLEDLPSIEDGAAVDDDTVHEEYDEQVIPFPGTWSTNNRVCLRGRAPRPCTVLAAVMNVDARG